MEMREKYRICPYSGEEFIPKRSNQIYSCPENRIKYNNELGKKKRARLRKVNKPLEINEGILNELMNGRTQLIIHNERLVGMGFSFKHFTHIENRKGVTFYGVYDYYLERCDENNYKIIKV